MPLPVPADCRDGVLAAYWRRPEAYLDSRLLMNCSSVAQTDQRLVAAGIERLRGDLADGLWHARHADLMTMDQLDAGYRLLVSSA